MKRTNELLVTAILGWAASVGCAFGGDDARPYPDSGAKADGKNAGDGGAVGPDTEGDGGAADGLSIDLGPTLKGEVGGDVPELGRDSGAISTDAVPDIAASFADTALPPNADTGLASNPEVKAGDGNNADVSLVSNWDAAADADVDGRLSDASEGG